jgi:hypothetical protein
MTDLKLDANGDLEISDTGDISITDSINQAVRVRLLWFAEEWRLGPDIGFPYFEEVFVKNPSEAKIRHLIRETVMEVDGVTDVNAIDLTVDKKTRSASIAVTFSTDEDTFREEVTIWQNTVLRRTAQTRSAST